MPDFYPTCDDYQRRRWMRGNAYLYIRQDAARFAPPQAVRQAFCGSDSRRVEQTAARNSLCALSLAQLLTLQEANARLRVLVADLKFELTLRRLARKYSPDQPRVPAGNPDGGQWTDGGAGGTRVRFAAADKPKLGRGAVFAIALEMAQQLIKAYRSERGLFDLFGSRTGTVAVTTFKDGQVFGSNSTSPTFKDEDDVAAGKLRQALIEKYPDLMKADNIGRKPNDATYHAEANVLVRAARANGGTLANETLEVFVDRDLCGSCTKVLPYIGLELGNPTVTFVGPRGLNRTMRNGSWID